MSYYNRDWTQHVRLNDRLTRAIRAMLQSDDLCMWIGYYAHGRTEVGDPFIVLYPKSDMLVEKACRVYEHDWDKLPPFINTAVPENAPQQTKSKDKERARGNLFECPSFEILRYNGKETPMGPEKRFSDVFTMSNAALDACNKALQQGVSYEQQNGRAQRQPEQTAVQPQPEKIPGKVSERSETSGATYADGNPVSEKMWVYHRLYVRLFDVQPESEAKLEQWVKGFVGLYKSKRNKKPVISEQLCLFAAYETDVEAGNTLLYRIITGTEPQSVAALDKWIAMQSDAYAEDVTFLPETPFDLAVYLLKAKSEP